MPPYSNPPALSRTDGGRKYALLVEQQPQRARMCGFGDKDRRPITPPPCVRLVISDAQTGVEIDINSIEHSMYVLNVDLWDEFASREVNLVSHSPTTPHIGSSTASSYAEIPTAMAHSYNPGVLPGGGNPAMLPNSGRPQMQQMYPPGNPPSDVATYNAPYNPYPGPPQVSAYSQPQQPNGNGHYAPINQQQYPPRQQGPNDYGPGQHNGYHHPPINGYGHGPQSAPPQQGYYGNQHYIPTGEVAPRNQSSLRAPTDYIPNGEVAPRNQSSLLQYNNGRPGFEPQTRPVSSTPPSGMYTRNLIGSLSASAFRLTDVNERIGIWFVLQDLSVRTEGSFRLRFSFVNVGLPSTAPDGTPANNGTNSIVNTGKAPVLAQTFSDVFVVYSAKRFPGVVESTPLSKCFATQGIKIPIRKDAQNSRANGANGANRDDEDEEY